MDTTPMPITTYSQLQSAVGLWLGHGLFTSTIPDFIALFEAAANRRLRVRQMEASATMTPSSGSAMLPADYLAWRRVTFAGSLRVELDYVAPSWLQAAYPAGAAGVPAVFTIEGAALKLRPINAGALELLYFQK